MGSDATGDPAVHHRDDRLRINERMGRRVEYLQEEVPVLRELLTAATSKTRIAFTPEQRQRLARKGKALTPEEREACCQIVRPARSWPGFDSLRPRNTTDPRNARPWAGRARNYLRALVLRLANENLGWGYTKIRDALRGLKIEIGRTMVAGILADAGIEPAPERSRKRTWKQFLRNHWETLYACDFIAVETLGVFGTVRLAARSAKIESDGTLRKAGSAVGAVESGGTIRKAGSSWGSASSCCGDHGSKRTVAAALVLFGELFD